MKKTTTAYLAITIQALIIGFSFLFVKIALRSTDTFSLLAHRMSFAAAAILIYQFFTPERIKIDARGLLEVLPICIVYPISFFLFQTIGLKTVGSSEAGIVYAIVPILTLFIARLVLNEQIGRSKKLLMLLSVAGVIFINVMNGFSLENYNVLGFLCILISAVSFASYNVLAKKLTVRYSVFTLAAVMSISGCLVFNGISVTRHLINGNLGDYFAPFSDPSFVVAMFYLGVLSSLVTSLLSMYALDRLEATKVGLFNNVSTVVNILSGTIFLHEPLFSYHYFGIAAILAGTIGFNLVKTSAEKERS